MIRSLFTGVSGLKNFQTKMDVISNNIANVNTTAFKRGRVCFHNIFSETLRHGQQAFGGYGGLNPIQVGLGVTRASIDTMMDRGNIESTGKNTDVAIEGEGFFISKGYDGMDYYTRDGNFNIGPNHDLVMTNTGYNIQGWVAKRNTDTGALEIEGGGVVPEKINFAHLLKDFAKKTSNIKYSCNLNSGSEERDIKMGEEILKFKDSAGNDQELKFKFKKIDANNWMWSAYDDTEGHVANGRMKCDDDGKILESFVEPKSPLATEGTPFFTYDPDGNPQPAMSTSPLPHVANSNYSSGKAGSMSAVTIDDSKVVTEDIEVIFDGGDPEHASSYRVVGSERGFIGAGILGGEPARIEGALTPDLIGGNWIPASKTSFTITDGFTGNTTDEIVFNGGLNYSTDQITDTINEAMRKKGVRATAYFDSTLGQFQIVSNNKGSNRSLTLNTVTAGDIAKLGLDGVAGTPVKGKGASCPELLGTPKVFGTAPLTFPADIEFTVKDATGGKADVKIRAFDTTVMPPEAIPYPPGTIIAEINTALKQNGLECTASLIDSDNDGILDQMTFSGKDSGTGEFVSIAKVSGNMALIGLPDNAKVYGTAATSKFDCDGISFEITEGDDVWIPNDKFLFSTTAEQGKADSVKIYCPPINQDVVSFKTSVIDKKLGTKQDYKIEGAVSRGALHQTSITVYDSLGAAHTIVTEWEHMNKGTKEWDYHISYAPNDPEIQRWLKDPMNNVKDYEHPTENDLERANNALIKNRKGTMYFEDGKLNVTKSEIPPFEITPKGSVPMEVSLDGELISHFNSEFTTKAESQDGYEMGVLEEVYFEEDGTVRGVYSNGQMQPIAMVALATFNNPYGLESQGNNLFSYSPNSGMAIVRRPGMGGSGVIKAASLEMSNVDISEEFTNMIVTQRAFQANSRVITTSDELLQELVNLKR